MTRITIEQAQTVVPKGWEIIRFASDVVTYAKEKHRLKRDPNGEWHCFITIGNETLESIRCSTPERAIQDACGIVTRRKMDFIQALIEVSNHG